MKRVLSIIMAAGLALGLAGCGESGGGFWPATPATTTGDKQVSLIGSDAKSAAKVILEMNGNALSKLSTAMESCEVLQANGFKLGFSRRSGAILAASTARKFESAASGFHRYYNEVSNAVSETDYVDTTYDLYVKYYDSNGQVITPTDTGSAISVTGAVTMEYYGKVMVKYEQPAISCSTSGEKTPAAKVEFTMTFGSSSKTCVSSFSGSKYFSGYNGKMALKGTVDGQQVEALVDMIVKGDECIAKPAFCNLFLFDTSVASTNADGDSYMGKGKVIITVGGDVIEGHADEYTYKIYVNGSPYSGE